MSRRAVRVAILGINYAPEPTGIAPYTTGLAQGLAKRGFSVRVLTGYAHYPQWKRSEAFTGLRSVADSEGVEVHRLNHHVPAGPSWFGRAVMELTFGLQLLTSRWGAPDVVVCVTPPLLAATMSALRVRLMRRRPAVGLVVHDLYGRGIAEMGALPTVPARLVEVLESVAFRLADGVTVIHDGFAADLVDGFGVEPDRIREIRNWNHVNPPDDSASAAFRRARGWSADQVVVLHAGNMGHKQGLENVIAAAALAESSGSPVLFVLLGDGNQRSVLQAAGAGLSTLQFLPTISDDDFPAALGAADVLLVNERPGVSQMAVPSKLTSYFRSGKPVLAATDASGLTAGELTASGAGVLVPAGRPDMLLVEALRLGGDGDLARRLGAAGQRYCEARLSEDVALDLYEQWIIDLAGGIRAG